MNVLAINQWVWYIINEGITIYVDEMNVAFITGTTDLSTFDSYLSTLDSMGLKELLKVKQQQYDRFVSSTR